MNYKEIIRDSLLTYYDKVHIEFNNRRLAVQVLPQKATVLMGVRRSGKSTYFLQLAEKIVASGVPKENIVMINFVDDRLHFFSKKILT